MKKMTLIGCALFVAGLIIAGVSFAAVGFNFTKISTNAPYEEKTFTSAGTPSSFSLKEQNGNVSLGLSPDDKVHVRYFENDKETYEITDQNGALAIKKVDHYQWYDRVLVINFGTPAIEVLLPKNFSGDVTVDSSNGRITADSLSGDNLSLTTDNGEVEVSGLEAHGTVEAASSNGHLNLSALSAGGAVTLKTLQGWVRLEDAAVQSLAAETSNGDVDLVRVAVKEDCSAKSQNGAVSFEELDVLRVLQLKNSNGAIRGSIVGKTTDFTIGSHTSNGSNSLPEALSGGSKTLTAQTDNGDIDVTFTQD